METGAHPAEPCTRRKHTCIYNETLAEMVYLGRPKNVSNPLSAEHTLVSHQTARPGRSPDSVARSGVISAVAWIRNAARVALVNSSPSACHRRRTWLFPFQVSRTCIVHATHGAHQCFTRSVKPGPMLLHPFSLATQPHPDLSCFVGQLQGLVIAKIARMPTIPSAFHSRVAAELAKIQIPKSRPASTSMLFTLQCIYHKVQAGNAPVLKTRQSSRAPAPGPPPAASAL